MSDKSILEHISALVDEEQQLRDGTAAPGQNAERIRHIEHQLDQCWDLLRQRRALRETGQDPDQAQVRPPDQVEGYLN